MAGVSTPEGKSRTNLLNQFDQNPNSSVKVRHKRGNQYNHPMDKANSFMHETMVELQYANLTSRGIYLLIFLNFTVYPCVFRWLWFWNKLFLTSNKLTG